MYFTQLKQQGCHLEIGAALHNVLFTGKISSLQRDKNNIKEISKGQECGIVVNNFNDFQIDDRIISYALVEEDYV